MMPVLDYCNKVILAPMVRGSLIPLRLLALRNGADLVYTDEIIDHNVLGTVDYVNENKASLLFRTTPLEKEKLVFQIGTADADRAIRVAKMVQHDVSAIDINMGCPKAFSTSIGIGAALLSNVDNAKKIVHGLVQNIQLPITCKIRISDNIDKTIAMVKDFETLGVSAIAVHGRTRYQSRTDPVDKNAIRQIAESVNIPIIANGGSLDIQSLDDVLQFKLDCGASSVMVARAAQINIGVFRKEGPIPVDDLITQYLKLCIEYDNSWVNTNYSVKIMFESLDKMRKSIMRGPFYAATTLEEICDLWKLGDYCRAKQSQYKAKGLVSVDFVSETSGLTSMELVTALEKMFNEGNIIAEWMRYSERSFNDKTRPKTVLTTYCDINRIPQPTYDTKRVGRKFYSIMTFQEKQYASVVCHRDVSSAEQASALVCSFRLGLYEKDFLQSIRCLF